MTGCRLLPWDTQFFGVRIARLDAPAMDAAALGEAESWAQAHAVECLYVLTDRPLEDRSPDYLAVDERITLRAQPSRAVEPVFVRRAVEADIPILRALAAANHRITRFHADRRFASHADRLYETWIEQSVRDEAVDVFVPPEAEALGYVSCLSDGAAGHIGLLGVSPKARGRGVGRELVTAALDWCAKRPLQRMDVVTQGANVAALRLYESCGFEIVRTQYWYHRWFVRAA